MQLSSRILYQDTCCVVVNKLKGEAVEGAQKSMALSHADTINQNGVAQERGNKDRQKREDFSPSSALGPQKSMALGAQKSMAGHADINWRETGIVDLPKKLKEVFGARVELVEAVNRLDVPVTGCALFALSGSALAFLNACFSTDSAGKNSSVEKIYWAIVEKPAERLCGGMFSESPFNIQIEQTLTHWIETNSKTNKSFAFNEEKPYRKKAVLKYKIIGEGKNYLFVEVKLFSGRHHQIRAQLAAVGLHIKGDLKYGAKRSEKDGGIRLHARSLSFPAPLNKDKIICVTADPPQPDALWQAFQDCVV